MVDGVTSVVKSMLWVIKTVRSSLKLGSDPVSAEKGVFTYVGQGVVGGPLERP